MNVLRKKRVLLLSEGFGSGHTQAAYALSAGLHQTSSEIFTHVMELGASLNPTIAPWVFKAYLKTVTSFPALYGQLYRNQYGKPLNRFLQLALHRLFYGQTKRVIERLKPDAIVCTHPFPSIVVSRLKRMGMDLPLYSVVTDYDAHGTWVNKEVDKYFVSTELVRSKIIALGVPADKVEVTGIPIHPNFSISHSKEEIRREFSFKAIPTVLIMGGGWGMQRKELLYHMAEWSDRVQLIICLGSNEKARKEMLDEAPLQRPNIHILGYTPHIDKLMDVSDLLITKPGGMTCTEALAKGMPMLFYNPIPGQEEENCQYFIDQGYGQQITALDMIDYWFTLLLEQNPALAERRSRVQMDFANRSLLCSEAIVHKL